MTTMTETVRYIVQKKLPPDPRGQRLSEWEYITSFTTEKAAHHFRQQLHAEKQYGTYRIVGTVIKEWVHLETTIAPETPALAPAPVPVPEVVAETWRHRPPLL